MTAAPLPPLATDRKPACWLGIDPGLDGAIAALIEGCPLPSLFPMPTVTHITGTKKKPKNKRLIDEIRLRTIFSQLREQCGDMHALIETAQLRTAMRPSGHNCPICRQSHMIPNQGMTSQAEFKEGYGLIRGILCGLGIGYESVAARTWKAQVFDVSYASSDVSEKELSRRKAQELYPICSAKFALVKSHGLAEALLLADFNRKRNEAPF